MTLTINSNTAALNVPRELSSLNSAITTSIQRLSSGKRINSAKDDPAGLQISNLQASQISGLNLAARSINDGISLTQVAEGALSQSSSLLQQLQDLALQSGNGALGASERQALQAEASQLTTQLNDIARTTSFNGQNLLDGNFGAKAFQIGSNANDSLSVSLRSAQSSAIGKYQFSTSGLAGTESAAGAVATTNTNAAGTLTIAGPRGSQGVQVNAGASAEAIAASVNAASDQTGVTAQARTVARLDNFVAHSGATETLSFQLTGANQSGVTIAAEVDPHDLGKLSDAINKETARTGITAVLSSDKSAIDLVSDSGKDIAIANVTASDHASTIDVTNRDISGAVYDTNGDGNSDATARTITAAGSGNVDALATGSVQFTASKNFTVRGLDQVFNATQGTQSATLRSVASIDLGTQSGAQDALETIASALENVDAQRTQLGAARNSFDHALSNVSNSSINTAEARSRISDTDYALEASQKAKNQLLQQAGLAVLAQANASAQSVLALLH